MWFWVAIGSCAMHGMVMHQTVEAAIFGAAACIIAQLQINSKAASNQGGA